MGTDHNGKRLWRSVFGENRAKRGVQCLVYCTYRLHAYIMLNLTF